MCVYNAANNTCIATCFNKVNGLECAGRREVDEKKEKLLPYPDPFLKRALVEFREKKCRAEAAQRILWAKVVDSLNAKFRERSMAELFRRRKSGKGKERKVYAEEKREPASTDWLLPLPSLSMEQVNDDGSVEDYFNLRVVANFDPLCNGQHKLEEESQSRPAATSSGYNALSLQMPSSGESSSNVGGNVFNDTSVKRRQSIASDSENIFIDPGPSNQAEKYNPRRAAGSRSDLFAGKTLRHVPSSPGSKLSGAEGLSRDAERSLLVNYHREQSEWLRDEIRRRWSNEKLSNRVLLVETEEQEEDDHQDRQLGCTRLAMVPRMGGDDGDDDS